MIDFTEELQKKMLEFHERFHDSVPICQIAPDVTTQQLIEAIDKCLERNMNLLPEIFDFTNSPDIYY